MEHWQRLSPAHAKTVSSVCKFGVKQQAEQVLVIDAHRLSRVGNADGDFSALRQRVDIFHELDDFQVEVDGVPVTVLQDYTDGGCRSGVL
jgi:hypothetical protein